MKYNYLKMDTIVNCNRLKPIETGIDKNAIGRVKHHKAGAARADNGSVVYKKLGELAKTC